MKKAVTKAEATALWSNGVKCSNKGVLGQHRHNSACYHE